MRNGWAYSLTAGIVALPFVIGFVVLLGHGPISSLPTVGFTLGAIVAARLGGWLALLFGGRDHGVRATAFTFFIYIFVCGAIGIILFHIAHPTPVPDPLASYDQWQVAQKAGALPFAWEFVKESFAAALFVAMAWGWLIFIACAIGLLLFDRLLRVFSSPQRDV
jgi:hypothetical protein